MNDTSFRILQVAMLPVVWGLNGRIIDVEAALFIWRFGRGIYMDIPSRMGTVGSGDVGPCIMNNATGLMMHDKL